MSFIVPYYAERGQKSNLGVSLDSEDEQQPLEQNDEVNADVVDDLEMEPGTPSVNSNNVTPYSKDKPAPSKLSRRHQSTPSMATVLKNYFEEKQTSKSTKKVDHLQKFFDAMQETVRTFSPRHQIEIKSKISNLVSEYELKDLMSNPVSNMPETDYVVHRQGLSNIAPHSSTESDSSLLSPGSETQFQSRMNLPAYTSLTNSPPSHSPLLSPQSDYIYSDNVQGQEHTGAHSSTLINPRTGNFTGQCQDEINRPSLNFASAPRLSSGNSGYPSKLMQEKNTNNLNRNNLSNIYHQI